jgi:hypothetical protein
MHIEFWWGNSFEDYEVDKKWIQNIGGENTRKTEKEANIEMDLRERDFEGQLLI